MNTPFVVVKGELPRAPNDWDRSGLPAWAYTSQNQLELERNILFKRHWQLAGHVGNAPEPGDYFCFDVAGERAIILRDKQGDIRVFHNVCRHRGSRVVAEPAGRCGTALVCPFHGWSFNLDGTLRSVPQPRSLPPLAPDEYGLVPVEFEIWHGLIFVRFLPGPQPSVAEVLARHETEVAPYRIAEMVPTEPFWTDNIDANWKCVRDVDNEGYHVAIAHPGLQDLYGNSYFDEDWQDGTARSFASFDDKDARLWSVRNYKAMLPEVTHLPESHRDAWLYIGLFPNAVLAFYPESVAFYQEFPLAVDKTLQRGGDYILPGETRELRVARYLSDRINRETGREDVQLTIWSNEAAHSSGYQGIILSDLEYGVRDYHDQLRAVMPVLNEDTEPAAQAFADINAATSDGTR